MCNKHFYHHAQHLCAALLCLMYVNYHFTNFQLIALSILLRLMCSCKHYAVAVVCSWCLLRVQLHVALQRLHYGCYVIVSMFLFLSSSQFVHYLTAENVAFTILLAVILWSYILKKIYIYIYEIQFV